MKPAMLSHFGNVSLEGFLCEWVDTFSDKLFCFLFLWHFGRFVCSNMNYHSYWQKRTTSVQYFAPFVIHVSNHICYYYSLFIRFLDVNVRKVRIYASSFPCFNYVTVNKLTSVLNLFQKFDAYFIVIFSDKQLSYWGVSKPNRFEIGGGRQLKA